MAEPDHAPAGGQASPPATAPEPLPASPRAPVQPPPPPAAAGPTLPLTDLLTLARAILRETGELPTTGGAAGPAGGSAAGGGPSSLVTPAQLRGPLPKEQKKFYKLGAPLPPPPPAAGTPVPLASAPPVSPGEEAGSAPSPAPWVAEEEVFPAEPGAAAPEGRVRAPRAATVEERTAGRRRSLSNRQRTTFWLVSLMFMGLAFAAGMSFSGLPRPRVPGGPAAPAGPAPAAGAGNATSARALLAMATAPEEGDRRALATLNEAMLAQQARDWPRASALYERAGKESARVPGVTYHRAEIALRQGNAIEANTLAERAQELGENVDEAFALRAVLAQRAGNNARALDLLESASRANPYVSRYWLYQGQLLRQSGKLQEAIGRLQGAIVRAEEPAQIELIELFLRLTKLELGQEADFSDELAAKLSAPSPTPDWLLTAAGRDLQQGRFTEGANTLRRALVGRSPGFVMLRLNDVFFRRYASRPELAPLYAELLPPMATPPASVGNFAPPSGAVVPPASTSPANSAPPDANALSPALPMSPDVPASRPLAPAVPEVGPTPANLPR